MLQGMSLLLQPQLKFVLSPNQRQSLELLRLPAPELADRLREWERTNPLLEIEWPEDRCLWTAGERERRYRANAEPPSAYPDAAGSRSPAETDTLERELLAQIRLSGRPPAERAIASYLAGNLNEAGYLTVTAEEAAAWLNRPEAAVRQGLRLLQSLEPAGVGAFGLVECLLLQAERLEGAHLALETLIREHLPDVARRKWKELGRALRLGPEELAAAIAQLRSLHPKPGAAYGRGPVPYAVPEARLFVAAREGGRDRVAFRAGAQPTVRLRSFPRGGSEAWCRLLEERRQEAAGIRDGMRFRARTLRAVILAVAEEQRDFLKEGHGALRPLKLETIARKVGCHPSTVSRAASGKYVETPFGLIALGAFFSAGLNATDSEGEEVSARAVRGRIRALIGSENPSRALTDAKIAEALALEGVRISRRTVAKYREEMGLPSSAQRSRSYSIR